MPPHYKLKCKVNVVSNRRLDQMIRIENTFKVKSFRNNDEDLTQNKKPYHKIITFQVKLLLIFPFF